MGIRKSIGPGIMENIIKFCMVIRMAVHVTGLKSPIGMDDEIQFPGAGR
jgi:hypothetical protein